MATAAIHMTGAGAGRWLRAWSALTVAVAAAALFSGAVVTSLRVGMADPVWPTYPWHLLLISWTEPSPGFLIEHSHRLLDYLLGCCVIGLAALTWRGAPVPVPRWLGPVALAAVITQGILGGLRVRLNELMGTDLAFVHGCFGQLVFGLLVVIAALSWSPTASHADASARPIWRASVATVLLVYLQLILGAVTRHTNSVAGRHGHLAAAVLVCGAAAWLAVLVLGRQMAADKLARAVIVLGVLLGIQLLVGLESWLMKYGAGPPELQPVTLGQGVVRSLHFLLGSLVFGASLWISVRARQATRPVAVGGAL